LKLSRVLASSCRQKIIEALAVHPDLPITKLVTSIRSTYNEVNRNLVILEKEGIIVQHYVGQKRLLKLNYENEKTLALVKALYILNH
jgi:predicted transcriptional regulator